MRVRLSQREVIRACQEFLVSEATKHGDGLLLTVFKAATAKHPGAPAVLSRMIDMITLGPVSVEVGFELEYDVNTPDPITYRS